VCEDQGYNLYKIKDKPDKPKIADLKKLKPDFQTDFSNWVGTSKIEVNDLKKTLFPMQVLGIRGNFTVERILGNDGNTIRLQMRKANFNERPEIQFGYFIQSEDLNLIVNDGDIVSFTARIRGNANRYVRLYVQDKTDYWSSESEYLVAISWKDVIVRKKIREGVTKICLGIDWKPESTEEWLEIRSIRIFIE
jgi:hypothetical protein